jgi:hypothetical protein
MQWFYVSFWPSNVTVTGDAFGNLTVFRFSYATSDEIIKKL